MERINVAMSHGCTCLVAERVPVMNYAYTAHLSRPIYTHKWLVSCYWQKNRKAATMNYPVIIIASFAFNFWSSRCTFIVQTLFTVNSQYLC